MFVSEGYRFVALDEYLVSDVPFDNDGRSARTVSCSSSSSILVVWSRHVTNKQNFLTAAVHGGHDG